MGIADNEVIERAMDAAEASMAETSASEVVPTETADTEGKTEDLVETVETKKALEKSEETKDPETPKIERAKDGKFTKSAKFDKAGKRIQPQQDFKTNNANVVDTEAQITLSEPVAIEPPTFWSSEDKANFAKATPEVRKAVLRYEEQRNKYVSQLQRDAERGKTYETKLYEGYDPKDIASHKAELRLNGVRDEVEELHRYRAWDKIFKSDPKRAISALMQKNGINAQALSEDEQNQEYIDPRIEQAMQEAQAAKMQAEELKASFEAQKDEAFRGSVDSFKAGKDSQGNTRKAFAEMYAPQISQVYDAIQAQNPMPMNQALNHAYEHVLKIAREQFGVKASLGQIAPKATEEVMALAKKAKAASSSISGAPKNSVGISRPKAKTIDEALDRAEEQVYGGR